MLKFHQYPAQPEGATTQEGVQQMSISTRVRRVHSLGLVAAFLVFAGLAFPQSTGTIRGTITDPSGAPVAAVAITVHNERTGEERTTTTDSSGIYLVPSLPVGTYRVSVKAPGMAPMTAGNVEVSSAARSSRTSR